MNKRILMFGLLALMVMSFSSCSGLRKTTGVQTASFVPNVVRVESNIRDYVQLGETTVDVEYRTYFGLFTTIDKVNGEDYNFREVKYTMLEGKTNIRLGGRISKALYKAVEEYPSADYYVPVVMQTEVQRLFLGAYKKESVVIKAYKLK